MKNRVRNEIIAAYAKQRMAAGKSVLVIVTRINHGERLTELIPGAVFMKGGQSAATYDRTFDALRSKQLLCLVTDTAKDGMDIPSLDCVVVADGHKDSRLVDQRCRMMTASPGKTSCELLDFLDNVVMLRSHALRRRRIYQSHTGWQYREVEWGAFLNEVKGDRT